MRLLNNIKFDIRFQFRHGFYLVYLFVSLLYAILLRYLPENWRETALVLIVFTDTSVLGFFFIGGLVLMEKGQQTLECLFITPLRLAEYFIAKVISLTFLSLVMSLLIMLCGGIIPDFPPVFISGLIFSSVLFVLIGCILVAKVKDVNHYFLNSVFYCTVIFLPVLDYLGIYKSALFYLLPTQSALILMAGGFHHQSPLMTGYAVLSLAGWITVAYIWAGNWFSKYVILTIGDNQ